MFCCRNAKFDLIYHKIMMKVHPVKMKTFLTIFCKAVMPIQYLQFNSVWHKAKLITRFLIHLTKWIISSSKTSLLTSSSTPNMYNIYSNFLHGMTLNCIWWWGSCSGNVEHLFIAITSRSTLGQSGSTC